jgi:HSP20 family protein
LAAAERLQSQLSRFLEGWPGIPALAGFIPRADVEETDDAYIVEVELPGVKKNDIDISVAGRRLTVSGELKERERKGVLRRRTRSVGRFHYDVVLPNEIDDDAVTASLDEGVLSVRVPKAARERPRRIEVK